MCDYSLEVYGSVPAREGERYVTAMFPSGTIGIVSDSAPGTAVCMACDTPLAISQIPASMRRLHDLSNEEDAVFIRLDSGTYRDGVRFDRGKELSLQRFEVGCVITVRSLLEHKAMPATAGMEYAYLGA